MGACCSDPKIELPLSLPPHPRPPSPAPLPGSDLLDVQESLPAQSDLLLWLDTEIREGDGLLLALSQLLPEKQREVAQTLAESLELRKEPLSWPCYKAYFDRRRRLCTVIWTQLLMQRKAEYEEKQKFEERLKSCNRTKLLALVSETLAGAQEGDVVEVLLDFETRLGELAGSGRDEKGAWTAKWKGGVVALMLQRRQMGGLGLSRYFSLWKCRSRIPHYEGKVRLLAEQLQLLKSNFHSFKSTLAESFSAFTTSFANPPVPPLTPSPSALRTVLEEHYTAWEDLTRPVQALVQGLALQRGDLHCEEEAIGEALQASRKSLTALITALGRKTTPPASSDAACQSCDEVKEPTELKDELKGKEWLCTPSPSPAPSLLLSLLARLDSSLSIATNVAFHIWKHNSVPLRLRISTCDSYASLEPSRSPSPELKADLGLLQRGLFARNVLLQVREKTGSEKSLTNLQLAKFFEEMMRKKLETDQMDIKSRRWPKSIPTFILDYLTRLFGLRKLAIGAVNQLMPTLERGCREGLGFAVLFARLAQVFHESPTPYSPALFVTRKMEDFSVLVEKLQKEAGSPKEPRHYSMTGGEAKLADVLPYIYSLFDCDKGCGKAVIRLIRPSTASDAEFELFHLGWKLTKLAIQADSFYSLLSRHEGSEESLVTGLRRSLDLWTTTETLLSALKILIGGPITREALAAKVTPKLYERFAKRKDWVVSKYAFLTALIDVYKGKEAAFMCKVKTAAREYGAALTLADFSQLLKQLDPTVETERVSQLFQRAAGCSGDFRFTATLAAVLETLARYPVGSLARPPFWLKELAELPVQEGEETLESPSPPSALKRIKGRSISYSDSRLKALFPQSL